MTVIRAIGHRRSNAELVADLHALGYLRRDSITLDPTFGKGRWWTLWQPALLIASDLHTGVDSVDDLAPDEPWVHRWDFTDLPIGDREMDVTTFDPPYKLNGTPSQGGAASSDHSYGVGSASRWQDRHALIYDGIEECARVTGKVLVVKCMDQVVSGDVRWQTRLFADHAERFGFRLVDMLHVGGYRQQPDSSPCRPCKGLGKVLHPIITIEGGEAEWRPCAPCGGSGRLPRVQAHAHRDYSTALVLKRTPVKRPRSADRTPVGITEAGNPPKPAERNPGANVGNYAPSEVPR